MGWSDEPLCAPEDKARLEAENSIEQLNYITYLVNERGDRRFTEAHLLELQRLAVVGIYGCAGSYRTAIHRMSMKGSPHVPPEASSIPVLVPEMITRIEAERAASSGGWLIAAPYAMWRINWIHPFAGGNGRTSRAAAYLICCMGAGFMLPGTPSIPTLIKDFHDDYTKALRRVDASVLAGSEHIHPVVLFFGMMFLRQTLAGAQQAGIPATVFEDSLQELKELAKRLKETVAAREQGGGVPGA